MKFQKNRQKWLDKSSPKGSVFNKLKLSSTKQTKKSISLKWTKVSKASKYVIYGNKCGNSNKPKKLTTVSGNKKTFKNIKGKKLKKGNAYAQNGVCKKVKVTVK